MILGPIAESQLPLALAISGGNPVALISSSVSMIVATLTLLILASPLWSMWKDRRRIDRAWKD